MCHGLHTEDGYTFTFKIPGIKFLKCCLKSSMTICCYTFYAEAGKEETQESLSTLAGFHEFAKLTETVCSSHPSHCLSRRHLFPRTLSDAIRNSQLDGQMCRGAVCMLMVLCVRPLIHFVDKIKLLSSPFVCPELIIRQDMVMRQRDCFPLQDPENTKSFSLFVAFLEAV